MLVALLSLYKRKHVIISSSWKRTSPQALERGQLLTDTSMRLMRLIKPEQPKLGILPSTFWLQHVQSRFETDRGTHVDMCAQGQKSSAADSAVLTYLIVFRSCEARRSSS